MKKFVVFLFFAVTSFAYAEPEVARAQFSSGIENREPVDGLTYALNVNPVFFFTELQGFEGQAVVHRWLFNDNLMAEVTFNVGGPRWRVYSSKQIQPEWDGNWKVEVVDEAGVIVSSEMIEILNN